MEVERVLRGYERCGTLALCIAGLDGRDVCRWELRG